MYDVTAFRRRGQGLWEDTAHAFLLESVTMGRGAGRGGPGGLKSDCPKLRDGICGPS